MSVLDRFRQNAIDRHPSEAKSQWGWSRILSRIAMGTLAVGLFAQGPVIPAVAGLLGLSGAALVKLLRKKTTETSMASIGTLSKTERFFAVSQRLDQTQLWTRSVTYGAILSMVPLLFWKTAESYLKFFGWLAAVPWGIAALFTAIPVILLFWETFGLVREGRCLRGELQNADPPDSLGPAFSI